MFQPEAAEHAAEHAAEGASGAFNAGEVIIGHVANGPHPLIHLPTILGIDFSVTKLVLMLWISAAVLFLLVTVTVRKFLRQDRPIPTGFMTVLEIIVEFVRDSIVEPNVGRKWTKTWTPTVLTIGLFILTSNLIGIAGTRAHGFIKHWKNLIPGGVPLFVYPILIPIEIMGMFVRPFALMARLAANMTGGHIALLAIISFVFIFAQQFSAAVGVAVGAFLSVPLAVGVMALEAIVVVPVQAYVFTLLTAVFIGMAIHAHH